MNVYDKTGRVEQDFDKSALEELNRFRARKTFWEGSGHTCHGEVSFNWRIRSKNILIKLFSDEARNMQSGSW